MSDRTWVEERACERAVVGVVVAGLPEWEWRVSGVFPGSAGFQDEGEDAGADAGYAARPKG